MGNTYESSYTVSYRFEYDVKDCTANTGKCLWWQWKCEGEENGKNIKELIGWSKMWPSVTSYIVFIFCHITAYRMCGAMAWLFHLTIFSQFIV